jgi:hypothetical protein
MEDRTILSPSARPSRCLVHLSRDCESSRLQRQLLAHAYQRVCPQLRARLDRSANPSPCNSVGVEQDISSAAHATRVAAGA